MKHNHRFAALGAAVLIFAMIFMAAGCAADEPKFVTVGEVTVPMDAEAVDLRSENLTAQEIDELTAQMPECRILWTVPFANGGQSSDASDLILEDLTEEDVLLLKYMTGLSALEIRNCSDTQLLNRVAEAYPGLEIRSTVTLGTTHYDARMEELTLTDPDGKELLEKMKFFPGMKTVTLEGKLPEDALLLELKQAYPEVTFIWEFEMFGIPVSTMTEFVDLSGIEMASTEEVEAWLPYFYQLKQVDMLNCGISNEEMEELNLRNEGTKFVWSISLGGLRTVRTDITYFMPYLLDISVNNIMCKDLKYCHDVIFLDLGHMFVSDISFLEYMPKMQYLILADTQVKDVELIGQMQELKFLEVFLTDVEDISPLLNCSKMEDMNISIMGDIDCTPLYQMTWLDRLWVISSDLDYDEMQELNEALPNTMIVYEAKGCTLKGWRMGPNYYEMRDVVDLWYAIT